MLHEARVSIRAGCGKSARPVPKRGEERWSLARAFQSVLPHLLDWNRMPVGAPDDTPRADASPSNSKHRKSNQSKPVQHAFSSFFCSGRILQIEQRRTPTPTIPDLIRVTDMNYASRITNHISRRSRQLFISTVDAACSYLSPNHAISRPINFAGSFPSLVSESLRSARGKCFAPGGDQGALGWSEGAAHGLRGHFQLSAPRCAAHAG